jgi:uncharacterized protein YceK
MKKIIILAVVLGLTGCGEVAGMNDCDGVDTSQAPDNIIYNGSETTYVWGSCRKTYYK